MGLWARTTARMRLFCNCEVLIGEEENKNRINHAPNSCYFKNQKSKIKNQKSTIINRQSSIHRCSAARPPCLRPPAPLYLLSASGDLGIPDWELRARRKPSSRLRATGVPLNRSADRQYAAS